MKRSASIIMGLLLTFQFAVGQQDPQVEALLDEVGKRYKALSSFKAEFTYSLESPANGVNEAYKGEILVKGDKFYLKLGSQEIINNGNTVWTYLKDENEVNISDYSPDEDEISPNKIYTLYRKGYKYRILDEKTEKSPGNSVIELVPTDKNKPIFKVKIFINKKDKSIKSWKMFEKSGNRYTYLISKLTKNPPGVDDKAFVFDKTKYKGVAINDLR